MAKGALKKVAQRLITSHRHYLMQRPQISTSSTVVSVADHRGTQETGHSLWMKPLPESSVLKESLEATIENLKDDDEFQKELLYETDNGLMISHQAPKIDTHAMVKGLMESGFTLSQAEALTMTIVNIVNNNTDSLKNSMVSKSHAQLTIQKVASQLAILRRDMMIMEKTDFTELITKIERLTHELEQLQRTTKDEINKVSSDLTLDFNLEKGKVKDMHLDHTVAVQDKHTRIYEMINALEKEVQDIRSYIKTENATLQTTFERYKSDTMKLSFGAVATCMTIVLGFYRLWS